MSGDNASAIGVTSKVPHRRSQAVRGIAALIALICIANLSSGSWGQLAACELCTQNELHTRLLGLGALAWGAVALGLQRVSAGSLGQGGVSTLLALLAGAHLGLVGTQLAEPRLCVLCLSAALLASLAFGVQHWQRRVPLSAWVVLPVALFSAPPLLLGAA